MMSAPQKEAGPLRTPLASAHFLPLEIFSL